MSGRGASLLFGAANVVVAVVVVLGVFAGLPARWWPVDAGASLVAATQLAAGASLLARAPWAAVAARAASTIALALGLFTITLLAVTASWLSGVYGPVGKGGAIVLALVAALALPYLVVLPLAQLFWLRAVRAVAPLRAGDDRGSP